MRDIKFYLAILCCCICGVAAAQNISSASYKKVIDYFECSCVKIAEREKAKDLDCASVEGQVKIKKIRLGMYTDALAREIRNVNMPTETLSRTDLIKFLTTELLNDKVNYPNSYAFAHKEIASRTADIRKFHEDLKQFIMDIPELDAEETPDDLSMPEEQETASIAPAVEKRISEPVSASQQQRDESLASFFSFQMNLADLSLAMVVLVISSIYLSKVRRDFDSQLSKLRNKLQRNHDTEYTLANLQREMSALKNQIKELNERKPFENREVKTEDEPREVMFDVAEPNRPVVAAETIAKIFYMPAPNEDGSFDESSSSSVKKPLATLYEFKVFPDNPNKAIFTFCPDEPGMKKALNNLRQNITPVCYEENDAFNGMQRIVHVKSGIAQKEGEKWIVTSNNKAHVKYE